MDGHRQRERKKEREKEKEKVMGGDRERDKSGRRKINSCSFPMARAILFF